MQKQDIEELKREMHALQFITEGGIGVFDLGLIVEQTGKEFNFRDIPEVSLTYELESLILDACRKRCEQIEEELEKNTEL